MEDEHIEEMVWFKLAQKYFTETIISENNDPNIHFVNIPEFPTMRFPKDGLGKIPPKGSFRTIQPPKKRLYWTTYGYKLSKELLTSDIFNHLISIYRIDETVPSLENPPEGTTDKYILYNFSDGNNNSDKKWWVKLDPNIHVFIDKNLVKEPLFRSDYKNEWKFRIIIINKNEHPEEYLEYMENVFH